MRISTAIDKHLSVIFSDVSKYEYKYLLEFQSLIESVQSVEDKETLSLLCKVMALKYQEKQSDNPYAPVINLEENDYMNLEEALYDISYPVLTARIADLLWTTKNNIACANKAIEAYKRCAEDSFDVNSWTTCFGFIRKAARIASSLGKKNQPFIDFCNFVDAMIRNINGTDPLFLSISLIELLLDKGYKNLDDYVHILDKIICDADDKGDLHRIECAFELKIKLLHKTGDNEAKLSTQIVYAQYIEDKAKAKYEDEGVVDTQRAIWLYEKAVRLYLQANMREESNRIRHILEPAKRKYAENMPRISRTIDRKPIYDQLHKFAAHRNLIEQITLLSLLTSFRSKQELENKVLANHQNFLSSSMFSTVLLDHDGKAIVNIPPLDIRNPKSDTSLLEKHMHREATTLQSYDAMLNLEILFHIIRETHGTISIEDLSFLVDDNSLLPDDRKHIFKLGIMHGVNGDYYAALHLLVPQIENLFRVIATMCGALVTTFEEDSTESLKALSTIFDSPELQECYNEDVLFIFKGLMNDKAGANFRNRIAHGITDSAEGYSVTAIYFISAVIKLCSWYSGACLDIMPDLRSEFEEHTKNHPLDVDNLEKLVK